MNTTTVAYTPWGWTRDIKEVAEGVWRVTSPSHGGLMLSRKRWESLPADVRETMFTETFAEEDCEEPIAKTLLGVGDDRDRELALTVAGYFDRYAPALPSIRKCPPSNHHHAIAYRGGPGSEPFGRFDTRAEAESFANDPEMVRKYGRMEVVECTETTSICRSEGGRR